MKRLKLAGDRAAKAGKSNSVEVIEAERDAFEKDGTPPHSINLDDLSRKRDRARRSLEAAYKKAITDYTKKRDAEAGAIKDELAAFLEESDKLLEKATTAREGSRWEGSLREQVLRDDQIIKQSSSTILLIKKRKGANFTAEFTRQGVQILEFAGTIDSLGQVNWRVDRVVSGASTRNLVAGLVGKGMVKGNKMSLSYRIEGDNQFGEIEMKLKE